MSYARRVDGPAKLGVGICVEGFESKTVLTAKQQALSIPCF